MASSRKAWAAACLCLALAAGDAPEPPGVGVAYGQLCFWLRTPATRAACPEPWASDDAMRCLVAAMDEEAARRKLPPTGVVDWAIDHCESQHVISRWAEVPDEAIAAVAAKRGCPTEPVTWMALEVRQQSHEVPYWLLWHMALGVSHFVIYDNDDLRLPHDRKDSAELRAELDPFVRSGYVTFVSYSGREGAQVKAYGNAHARALKGGAAFLGALDLDEYLMPFKDRCATTLLRRCAARKECGAIQVNWRFARPLPKMLAGRGAASLWRALEFDVGDPNKHTKTFTRVGRAYKAWGNTPHASVLNKGFRHFRDDSATLVRGKPYFVEPGAYGAQRAVVYHAWKTYLLAWVKKRSLRGRASLKVRTTDPGRCPTCFASLVEMAKEYEYAPARGPLDDNGRLQLNFTRRMDAFMHAALARLFKRNTTG